MILLDTNVLVRIADRGDQRCLVARRAIHGLLASHERLMVVPQNLYEFWAVATRSRGLPPSGLNGLGMKPEQASQWLRFFERRFVLVPDREELYSRWHNLVRSLRIIGHRSHDARLVAAMHTHRIARLLTFNGDHFRDFGIEIIDPGSL
jgi:predicted nucleic acid-binding protein